MRKRIKQTTAALCMAFIFLTTACGSEQKEMQDESVVENIDKNKIEIEIAHDGRSKLDDTLQKIADGFNSSQELYEVSVRSNGTEETDIPRTQEPAAPITSSIFFTSDDSAAAYAQDARRMNLMSYLGSESGKDSLYSIINSLPANMYETVCDEERGVFYLPVSVTPPIFFYNKTVYDGMGLSLPQSYSQLRENCLSIYARYRTLNAIKVSSIISSNLRNLIVMFKNIILFMMKMMILITMRMIITLLIIIITILKKIIFVWII